ncbi:MAG: hypothetical protein ACE366_31870 [Bradymonadia bacterium]
MNIWDWVHDLQTELSEAGEHRLVQLIEGIPSASTRNQHAAVDAMYLEGIALARARKHPWLQIFFRHWHLQSRILDRLEVGDWMGEAVSLLEFANRPEHQSCPQSVCVTQDLVSCYGHIDGPGYAPERQAAAQETLDRINPTWPCFQCISEEMGMALVDAGDAEGALDFLNTQLEAVRAAHPHDRRALGYPRALAMLRAGRHEAAVDLLDHLIATRGNIGSQNLPLLRALALAHMGRFDEALEHREPFEQLRATLSHALLWAECTFLLVEGAAEANTWHVDQAFVELQHRAERQGVIRHSIQLAHWRASMALARNRPYTAARCADEIERLIPRLHRPLGAPEALAVLRSQTDQALAGCQIPDLPDTPEAFELEDDFDPEEALPWIAAACERWPDDERLLCVRSSTLSLLGRHSDARAQLEAGAAQHPESVHVHQQLVKTITTLEGTTAAMAYVQKRLGEAIDPQLELALRVPLAASVILSPGSAEADLHAALDHVARLIELRPTHDTMHHLQLIGATRLHRWGTVRMAAASLGDDITPGSTERPDPAGFGSPCRVWVEPHLTDGKGNIFPAIRTGPATARIACMGNFEDQIFYRDEYVIDPHPMNADALDEGELPVVRGIATLHAEYALRLFLLFDFDDPDIVAETAEQVDVEARKAEIVALIEAHLMLEGVHLGREDPYIVPDRGYMARLLLPPEHTQQAMEDHIAATSEAWPHGTVRGYWFDRPLFTSTPPE